MELILKEKINVDNKIKDFTLNPLNNTLITIGKGLTFFKKNFSKDKQITKNINNCETIKYIKEESQLFTSSSFYIINSNNYIYKCDSSSKKVISCIFKPNFNIECINVTNNGKIAYINSNNLYLYDSFNDKTISVGIGDESRTNLSLFINNENIIVKSREFGKNENNIKIFCGKGLFKIFDIQTENNHTFMKLIGTRYFGATANGLVEVWDAITNEMIDTKYICDSRITYIENDDEWFYFGTARGDLIVTNDKLEVVKTINWIKSEIRKIYYYDDTLYVLCDNNQLLVFSLFDEDNVVVVDEFMEKYKIHEEYRAFFSVNRVTEIENFIKKLEISGSSFYAPTKLQIFKALSSPISNKKVLMLGKEPYNVYPHITTGLSYEIKEKSWFSSTINNTLKNILKLIYYSYNGELKEIEDIKNEINKGNFKILPPDKIFKSWENQGVLLLNSALTVLINETGSHSKFWSNFTKDILEYISTVNQDITYFLWGKDLKIFEKNILSGNIIIHNHPSSAGNFDNPNDFFYGLSFINTKDKINWLGGE